MKKILLVLMFILMVGCVSALDLQVLSVSTSQANPPVLNQAATITTTVVLRNSSSNVATTLRIDYGNGNVVTHNLNLQPDTTTTVPDSVTYTSTGNYNVNATIDPNNAILEDTEANNNVYQTVSVTSSTTSVLLTIPNVQGNPGTAQSVQASLRNTGNVDISSLTLNMASALASGSNTIAATAVSFNPNVFAPLYSNSNVALSATVNIPAGQSAGTYTGTVNAIFNTQTLTFPITVIVNSIATGPSFTANDLEFVPSDGLRGQDVSQTLTITNTGNQALTFNLVSNLPSQYKVRLSQTVVTVAPGASVGVPVTLYIPLSQNSGRNLVSGGVTITPTNVAGITQTVNAYVTAKSMLELYKVTIETNNDGNAHSIRGGDTYDKDMKAGTSIQLKVYARNNFDSNSNVDIRDVVVDVRASGDLDVSETDDLNDLSYGDKDSVTIDASIPSDASDNDRYNLDITLRGIDQNGAPHTDKLSAQLEVKRTQHEVTIKSASLSPQTLRCSGKVTVNAMLDNSGRQREDDVHLLITNSDLGISQRFYGMKMDIDDTLSKSYVFSVDNTTIPGVYDILLTSFYDSDVDSDTQVLPLTVQPCPGSASTTTTPTGNTGNLPPMGGYAQVAPVSGASPIFGTASVTDSTAYVVLLAAAVIVVLAVIITLLVKFVF